MKDKIIKVIEYADKYITPIAWIMMIGGSIWACIDLQGSSYPWAGYVLVVLAILIISSTFISYRGKYICQKRKK